MAVHTKIALVTGGSRGLGKNMAIAIAKKGIDVIITYNSKKEEADSVVKEIESLGQKAAALQLNVADSGTFNPFFNSVAETLKSTFKTDKFDFLVNNAGTGLHNSFMETTEAEFDQLSNIHFKGPFFLTQKALNLMNDGGGIVNISTGLARFSFSGASAYASMKGAIETLTKYQAKELGERKIRANVVAPGGNRNRFWRWCSSRQRTIEQKYSCSYRFRKGWITGRYWRSRCLFMYRRGTLGKCTTH